MINPRRVRPAAIRTIGSGMESLPGMMPAAGSHFFTEGNRMLVMARKHGEKIIVRNADKEIEICVVSISPGGHTVRLGITADAEWNIVRKEIDDGRHPKNHS